MSLGEFKTIYWWEWAHRQLGRVIGLAFALPLAWFWLSGRLEDRLKPRLIALLALGGLQGAVGWWMVASGLTDRVDVSQYRLAVHLSLACAIFAATLWVARAIAPHPAGAGEERLRVFAAITVLAVLVQIFLGGLVAGLDAGLAFNDWPTMDGRLAPQGLLLLEPAWLNFFENPKTVQFTHRVGGYLLFLLILGQWLAARRISPGSVEERRAMLMVALVVIQAGLGVLTLVTQVPFALALAHQAGAVVLLGISVAHWRALLGPYPPVTAIEIRG